MTRKLLIPLFAISMAAFGCGSDSDSTPSTPDAGKDATNDVVTPNQTDTGATTDVPVVIGSDASTDAAPTATDAGEDAGTDAL